MEKDKKGLVDFAVTARKYKTTLTQKFINRPVWVKPAEGEIKALLPGTVVSIYVEVGQQVEKGEVLMIHEAMKMQNRILSPQSGVVESINVTVGERINKGNVMLVVKG